MEVFHRPNHDSVAFYCVIDAAKYGTQTAVFSGLSVSTGVTLAAVPECEKKVILRGKSH
jgi:hypothetical protein